jgi:hypothetical protein
MYWLVKEHLHELELTRNIIIGSLVAVSALINFVVIADMTTHRGQPK